MDRRTLMVVHAHPDDEVFSTGGIIAKYAAEGHRVVVVYGTRGEAGEIYDESLDPVEARERLGEIRERECREACALLGASDVYFLGYRDSGMVDTEDNQDAANFMNAPLDQAVERLLAIMRETQPQVVVTYDEGGGYGHPDHIMTHRVTVEAFNRARQEELAAQKLYHSAAARETFRPYVEGLRSLGLEIPWVRDDFDFDKYGTPKTEITAHIDVGDYVPRKKRALAVHRTQIKPDFFYLSLPDEFMRRYQGVEYFMRLQPPPRPGEQEADLLSGTEGRAEAA